MANCKKLGVLMDCSRNGVATVSNVKKMIDLIAPMGYNALQLYMEDVFEVENQPYFGYLRGRYTKEELKEIDRYGLEKGVEVMPSMQTLAHLSNIFHWETYLDMQDINGILLIDDPKTYRFIEDMLSTLSECFTSRNIHINMDEAFLVGYGKYRRLHGIPDQYNLLCHHLRKVLEICNKYGFKPMMASDMFFTALGKSGDIFDNYYDGEFRLKEELKTLVPKEVSLVYWDYGILDEKGFVQGIKNHKQFNNHIIYYAGAMTWYGFVPNNGYSLRTNEIAAKHCLEYGIDESYITLWGDNGKECSSYAALPNIYAYAQFMRGNFDMADIKRGFKEMFGIPFDEFMYLDLPNQVNEKPVIYNNPHKYFFYSDVFLGQTDCLAHEGFGAKMKENAEKLDKWSSHPDFGYIFRSEASLCRVLEYKCELGLKTRKAYQSGDKAALKNLAENDYVILGERIRQFYKDFKALWDKENKPYGFEIQDARFGGLIMRIDSCRECLNDYVNGKIDCIPELEEKILDFLGGVDKYDPEQTQIHTWGRIISASPI